MILKPPKGAMLNRGHPYARGLVGLWLMNEGGGNTVADLSGNGGAGSFNGDVNWVGGKYGPALNFLGDADYVSAETPPGFTDEITIIVSFRADVVEEMVLIKIADAMLKLDNGGDIQWWPNVGSTVVDYAAGYVANRTYTIAITHDRNNIYKWYVDGVLGKTDTTTQVAVDLVSPDKVIIGNYNGAGGLWDFDGIIDYLPIYNRALPATDIMNLYRSPFCMFEVDL